MVMLNTIMAEALDHCATELEKAVEDGTDFNEAVQTLLTEIISDHGKVIFDGNGFYDEWPIEAEQRGLKNLRTTVDALPALITPEAIELFSTYHVFDEREMHKPLRDRLGAVRPVHQCRGQPHLRDRYDDDPAGALRTRPSWPPTSPH